MALQGPIDDAFVTPVPRREARPEKDGLKSPTSTPLRLSSSSLVCGTGTSAADCRSTKLDCETRKVVWPNLVLFGDPQSNPLIAEGAAEAADHLDEGETRRQWVEYDPKTHVPVLIYPNPLER